MKFVKTIILLMTFCVMAFGNMDRINALGGNPGFWPGDDANVSLFPATVNNLDMECSYKKLLLRLSIILQ